MKRWLIFSPLVDCCHVKCVFGAHACVHSYNTVYLSSRLQFIDIIEVVTAKTLYISTLRCLNCGCGTFTWPFNPLISLDTKIACAEYAWLRLTAFRLAWNAFRYNVWECVSIRVIQKKNIMFSRFLLLKSSAQFSGSKKKIFGRNKMTSLKACSMRNQKFNDTLNFKQHFFYAKIIKKQKFWYKFSFWTTLMFFLYAVRLNQIFVNKIKRIVNLTVIYRVKDKTLWEKKRAPYGWIVQYFVLAHPLL